MGKLNECSTPKADSRVWRFVLDTLFCTELGIIKVYSSFPTMWTWMLAHAPSAHFQRFHALPELGAFCSMRGAFSAERGI